MTSGGGAQGFHQLAAIGLVADEVCARQRLYFMCEYRVAVPVQAPEEINEPLLEWLVQNDAGAPFRQPTAGLDPRQPDRDRAVEASFVNPIWQQPCRVLAALVIVDCPTEMNVSVDAGYIGWVVVGTGEPDVGEVGDRCVEIGSVQTSSAQ